MSVSAPRPGGGLFCAIRSAPVQKTSRRRAWVLLPGSQPLDRLGGPSLQFRAELCLLLLGRWSGRLLHRETDLSARSIRAAQAKASVARLGLGNAGRGEKGDHERCEHEISVCDRSAPSTPVFVAPRSCATRSQEDSAVAAAFRAVVVPDPAAFGAARAGQHGGEQKRRQQNTHVRVPDCTSLPHVRRKVSTTV